MVFPGVTPTFYYACRSFKKVNNMSEQPQEQAALEKKKTKISRESAEAQLNNFLDSYMIDPDNIDDEDIRAHIKTVINKLRTAIMKGMLEIAVDGPPIVKQHTRFTENKTVFEYGICDGVMKTQVASIESRRKQINELLSALSKMPSNEIKKFKMSDNVIAEALGVLFLL